MDVVVNGCRLNAEVLGRDNGHVLIAPMAAEDRFTRRAQGHVRVSLGPLSGDRP